MGLLGVITEPFFEVETRWDLLVALVDRRCAGDFDLEV